MENNTRYDDQHHQLLLAYKNSHRTLTGETLAKIALMKQIDKDIEDARVEGSPVKCKKLHAIKRRILEL